MVGSSLQKIGIDKAIDQAIIFAQGASDNPSTWKFESS
jgi:hypothetical protein